MRCRAIVFAAMVLGLAFVFAFSAGSAIAAEKVAQSTPEGLLAPTTGLKATNYGFRVNEGGGGALDLRWVNGVLGNTWAEGEWVPYQLVLTGVPAGLAGLDSIVISYDFNIGGNRRFVDLVRGIQVGTTQLSDTQAWPNASGVAEPMGTRTEVEAAQNNPNQYVWSGFTLLGLPNAQLNRTLSGGLDVPPGEERHIFKIYKSDLLAAGLDPNATTVVIYYQIHEARTFVWANALQDGYNVAPTNAWGGYLYGTGDWPTAGGFLGSGYVPGASGHVHIENLGGNKDVGVPIPEPLPGVISGVKWLDANADGVFDGGEATLSGWEIYIFGTVEGLGFEASLQTDGSGSYAFSNLAAGRTYTIKEDGQRDIPAEIGYNQTYPQVGTVVGTGTGTAVSPPPAGAAPVGWAVTLGGEAAEQLNLNFGNAAASVAITCPANTTVECDASVDPSNTGEPTVEGTCSSVDITHSDVIIPGDCPQSYTIERTWTATCLDNGTSDTCVQVITVEDATPPELTLPGDVTYECDDIGNGGVATAVDNCDPEPVVDYVDNTVPGACPQAYTIERTWTATDACGNNTSDVQYIYIVDTTDPYFVTPCPADDEVECDDIPEPAVMEAADNCDEDVEVTFDQTSVPGTPPSYTIVRTWTATDDCGNDAVCEQRLLVVDTTPPEITCPGDVTYECDDIGNGGVATAVDNCDPEPVVDYVDNTVPGDCPQAYTIERTWTAMDAAGNTATCLQLIHVEDTTPPELTLPGDVTYECDDIGNGGVATAVDNCDPEPVVDYVDSTVPGACAQAYTVERTWTATDACGNSTSDVQYIYIVDTTDPYFVTPCPEDATVECDNVGDPPTMEAADNCDEDVEIGFVEEKMGATPGVYTLVRTWTATDDCGNEARCQQTLTVVDTTPPLVVCPGDATFECDEAVVFGNPIVTDNCDPDPVVAYEDVMIPSPCPQTYTIERTWTITDAAGNVSRCVQNVRVEDTTPPTLTCAPDEAVGCNADIVFTIPTATDNCDPAPAVEETGYVVVPGDLPCQERHTKTWIAVDACGNQSEPCSQTVVRTFDVEAPVLGEVEDMRIACNAEVVFTPPSIVDNCDPAPVLEIESDTVEVGPGICDETHIRCWVGRDACGNVSEPVCQIIVRMVDTEPPVLTCAPDKTIPFGSEVIFDEPTASDNCSVVADVQSLPMIPGSGPEGQETYTQCWIVFDECGNASNECCQTITVEAEPSPYCTFACWDWGSACLEDENRGNSTKPACIRDEYFYDVFPSGVVIGDPSRYTAKWTSPEAVEEFECGYGIPWPLRRNYVNPERNQLGVLAGEILALRLNREFSCAGYLASLGYGGPDACYGDFVIPDSVRYFGGLTIDQFLAVADQAVGGNTAVLRAYGANIDHLWTTATYLNWLFSDCGGQLLLTSSEPQPSGDNEADEVIEPVGEPLPERLELTVRPNPLTVGTNVRLALPASADVSLGIYDVQGRRVNTLMNGGMSAGYHSVDWNGTDEAGRRVGSGVYFCRLTIGGRQMLMVKVMKL